MDRSGSRPVPEPTEFGSEPALSADQFVRALSESGLWNADEVAALVSSVPTGQRHTTEGLAAAFVAGERLTPYQADLLQRGETQRLVLGNYTVLDQLGSGGMGTVYKARHRRMKRIVALKVLSPRLVGSPAAVQRFQREVEAVARLSHPNIVVAHDADEAQGVHFLVTEYVDGEDLAHLVRAGGPLPVALAVDCAVQAAAGLAHAHAAGVVHRDVKPGNLLRDRQGTVKVLDLGLARFAEEGPSRVGDLTENGSILGTCDYMAPEQALDTRRADQRSDVYSLGCTLYFLLTGRQIFVGETSMEKVFAHREQAAPSLRDARPDVPPSLDAAWRKMVAKDPADRYPSMDAVALALRPFAVPPRPGERPYRPKIIRWVGAATVVGVALLAGYVSVAWFRPAPASPVAERTGPIVVRSDKPFETAAPPPLATARKTEKENPVADLPPDQLVARVRREMRQRNREFDGSFTPEFEGPALIGLTLFTDKVTDLGPIGQLKTLRKLHCKGSVEGSGLLADLTPLRGLQLQQVNLDNNPRLTDLRPLEGMLIQSLYCRGNHLRDLAPLRGMPLRFLYAFQAEPFKDLEPLTDMPLWDVQLNVAPDANVRAVRTWNQLRTINGKTAQAFLAQFPGR
jgi:tRNA A-37 threonylcarbamoyl transferase component Bud32